MAAYSECKKCGRIYNNDEPCPCISERSDLKKENEELKAKLSLENIERAYYQATNFYKKPSEIIQRLYQELNS